MHVSHAILMTLHLVPSNLSNKSISTKKEDSIKHIAIVAFQDHIPN